MINAAIVGMGGFGRRLVSSVQAPKGEGGGEGGGKDGGGDSPAIRFVAGVARTPAKVTDFAQAHGMSLTDDFAAALADPAIDAVVVVTPNSLHGGQAIQAAAAGKHVMVIKPLALRLDEAVAAVAAAAKAKVVLAHGNNRHFLPAIVELRRRVKAGALGEVVHAEGMFATDRMAGYTPGPWKTDVDESPPSCLASHVLDLMLDMLGPVDRVFIQSHRRTIKVELDEAASVLLHFKSGVTGYLAAFGATAPLTRLQVFGSGGWAEVRDDSHFESHPIAGETETVTHGRFNSARAELEAFAAAIDGTQPYPIVTDDAVHSVAVYEAISRSAETGNPETVV